MSYFILISVLVAWWFCSIPIRSVVIEMSFKAGERGFQGWGMGQKIEKRQC